MTYSPTSKQPKEKNMTNDQIAELQKELAGARFAAAQHLNTVEAQAKQIAELTACVATHQRSLIDHAKMRDANYVAVPAYPGPAKLGGAQPIADVIALPHLDDIAIDRFAAAMKAKMAKARDKGRGGWEDKAGCPVDRLQAMMVEHIAKGDPLDVGNFAMMLFNRGERTADVSAPTDEDFGYLRISDGGKDITTVAAERFWQGDCKIPDGTYRIVARADALGNVPSDDIFMPFMVLIENYMDACDYHGSQKGEKCEAAEDSIRAALIKLAAPVSGPSYDEIAADLKTARYTIKVMDKNKAAYIARIAELEQAAPVSGQGASIDNAEFRGRAIAAVSAMFDANDAEEWNKFITHIQAWADSRPRSEDSRAKVLEEEVAELTHVLGFETRVKCRLRDENISLRAALASSAAPSTSHAEAGGLWEWAPGLKLEEDEVIHYSEIYQTAEGLPVMTDSSQHSTWNVASVFKRAADGVDSRHPVRILTVEPSSAARPPASRPRSEDSRAKVLPPPYAYCVNDPMEGREYNTINEFSGGRRNGVKLYSEEQVRALASSAAPEPEVQAAEAKLYRDLTGDAMALGYDGVPAALEALRVAAPARSGEVENAVRYQYLRDEAWKRKPDLWEGGRAALMCGNHGEQLDRIVDEARARHLTATPAPADGAQGDAL